MDIGSLLVADAQPPKLVEPGKTPLHDPSSFDDVESSFLGVSGDDFHVDAEVGAVRRRCSRASDPGCGRVELICGFDL